MAEPNPRRWTPPLPPTENGRPELTIDCLPKREYLRRQALAWKQARYRTHVALRVVMMVMVWLLLNLAVMLGGQLGAG